MTEVGNYYEILGVAEDAPQDTIKSAYRRFMKDHHPDLNPGGENEELCRLASEAWTVLQDPTKRVAYTRSLHEVPAVEVEEEWAPSWGEEESWAQEEIFEEVVETPPAPQSTPTNGPVFEDEPSFGSEDSISKLPPTTIPEAIKNGKIFFRTRLASALLALLLMLVAPLIAFVTHPLTGDFAILTLPLAVGSAIAAAVYTVKWKVKQTWEWWALLALSVGAYLALSFIADRTNSSYGNLIVLAGFGGAVTFVSLPTLIRYFEDRKLIKPKALKKNNSFGTLSGSVAEELLEELLNPLWDIPGLRVFRMKNNGFSHMLLLHNKIVLLKPVYLSHKGVLKFSGPTLMNRFAAGLYQPVLEGDYLASIAQFTSCLPKSMKVYPMVVAVPGHYLMSFEKDSRTTIVAGDDVASLVANILLENEDKNVVDHNVAVTAFKAAHGVKS